MKKQRFVRSAIALACTFCMGTHVHAALTDGLVAYYPFNGNANDESGNNHHGVVNDATLTKDIFGKANSAYSFNGSNSYIHINDAVDLRATNKITSISLFIKPLSNSSTVIRKGISCWIPGWGVELSGASSSIVPINFTAWDGRNSAWNVSNTDNLTINQWNHIAMIADGKIATVYINGKSVGSSSINSNISIDTNSPISIGAAPRGGCGSIHNFYKGDIDEVRIYNRALTDAEVVALYNQGATTTSAPTCTLTPTPSTITAGQSATLTATCTPTATSYQWSDTACASTSATCTVTPNITTSYTVKGSNSGGVGGGAGGIITVYTTPELTIDSPEGFIAGKTITLKSNLLQLGIEYKLCLGTSSKNYNVGCYDVPIPFSFPMESNYDFYVAIKAIKNGVDVGFSNEVRVVTSPNVTVGPLLNTVWDQPNTPLDLDQDGFNQTYVAGCASVALGQIINYYFNNGYKDNWLDVLLKNVTVYPTAKSCVRGSFNLSKRDYDYQCIYKEFPIPLSGYTTLNNYSKSSDDSYVKEFLTYIALGLDSKFDTPDKDSNIGTTFYSKTIDRDLLLKKYGLRGSDSFTDHLNTILIDRFRFAIDDKSQIKKLTDIIDKKQPIFIGIFGVDLLDNTSTGHAVVLDGYKIENGVLKYHLNFGWGENDCNTKLWRNIESDPYIIAYKPSSDCSPGNEWLKFYKSSTKFIFLHPM